MSKTQRLKAQCLCQQVAFETEVSTTVGVCHCGMCRKWGGGPLFAVDCGTGLHFEGQENISVYDSSEWAQRAFCKHCGTHLYYRLKHNDEFVVPAGLFDDQTHFVLESQIFIDKKPAYYHLGNDTRSMTEAEVFAKYAPPTT